MIAVVNLLLALACYGEEPRWLFALQAALASALLVILFVPSLATRLFGPTSPPPP